jgi:hypothetical protein
MGSGRFFPGFVYWEWSCLSAQFTLRIRPKKLEGSWKWWPTLGKFLTWRLMMWVSCRLEVWRNTWRGSMPQAIGCLISSVEPLWVPTSFSPAHQQISLQHSQFRTMAAFYHWFEIHSELMVAVWAFEFGCDFTILLMCPHVKQPTHFSTHALCVSQHESKTDHFIPTLPGISRNSFWTGFYSFMGEQNSAMRCI